MKTFIIRAGSAVALACALFALPALHAIGAEDYPNRPVTIVVPFPPGASNDILGRYEADVLGRALHGTFVVENKTGVGGEIGISYAAKANRRRLHALACAVGDHAIALRDEIGVLRPRQGFPRRLPSSA